MIVSQMDIEKLQKMGKLLKEVEDYSNKLAFSTIYTPKINTILHMSAKKMVGCDFRFRLNPKANGSSSYSWGADNLSFVLTRDGIKEEFGFKENDFKCRQPTYTNWYTAYCTNATITKALTKLIGVNGVRSNEALKEHLVLRDRVAAVNLKNESSHTLITPASPISIQSRIDTPQENNSNIIKHIIISIHDGYYGGTDLVNFIPGDITKVARTGNHADDCPYEFNAYLQLGKELPINEYIQISEEPVYSMLTNLLEVTKNKLDKHIAQKTAAIEKILEDYGQYLVLGEL